MKKLIILSALIAFCMCQTHAKKVVDMIEKSEAYTVDGRCEEVIPSEVPLQNEDKNEKEEKQAEEAPVQKLSQKEKTDIEAFNDLLKSLREQLKQIFFQGKNLDVMHREAVSLRKKSQPHLYELKPDPKLKTAVPTKPLLEVFQRLGESIVLNDIINIGFPKLTSEETLKLGWQKSPKNRFKQNEIVLLEKYASKGESLSSEGLTHYDYSFVPQFYFAFVKYKTAHGYEVESLGELKIVKPEDIFKYGKDGIFALNERDWNIANLIEEKRIKYEETPLYHLNTYIPDFEQQWEKGNQADHIAQFENALALAGANKDKSKVQRAYDFLELLELLLTKPYFLAEKQYQYLKDDLKGKILALQFEQALLADDKEKIDSFGEKVKTFASGYLAQKHPDADIKAKLEAVLASYEKYKKGNN